MDGSPAPPNGRTPSRYWFAGLQLEPDGTLLRGEAPLPLAPQELAVLRQLLMQAGKIVCPADLKRSVWGDEYISSEVVFRCVAGLRERLLPADCIQRLYKRGFRIAAAVQTEAPRPATALPQLAVLPFACGPGIAGDLCGDAVRGGLGLSLAETIAQLLNRSGFAIASVAASESVDAEPGSVLAPREMGQTREADLVLTGSVYARPGYSRIRAAMIRADDGAELWVEDLLVKSGEAAEIASEVVRRLVPRLQWRAIPAAGQGAWKRAADSEQKTAAGP
jgi:DNA-binding winged helix-turn-helix (wHTH) protein